MLFGLTPELTQEGGLEVQLPCRPGLLSSPLQQSPAPVAVSAQAPPSPCSRLCSEAWSLALLCARCAARLPRPLRSCLLMPWLRLLEGENCTPPGPHVNRSVSSLSVFMWVGLPGGPVDRSPPARAGTQAPPLVRRDPTRLGATKPTRRN